MRKITGVFADDIKVDYNTQSFGLSLGRTDKYKIGGPNAYGYLYGDVFDRAEVQFRGDKFAVTAGYGKFKENGGNDSLYSVRVVGDTNFDSVKTGYGEIEGFFGNGSAVGVYYNQFSRSGGTHDTQDLDTDADNLWGAYASVNMGSKWNLLVNYESIDKNGIPAL